MKNKKFFTTEELNKLPIGFKEFYEKYYSIPGTIFKKINSNFFQNSQKQKIRLIHKPVSRVVNEESIFQ